MAEVVNAPSSTPQKDLGKLALQHFVNQKEQLAASVDLSEIFTDRLAAALEVISPRGLFEGLEVDSITALDDVIALNSDAIFFGRPYFNSDTAGFAVVKQGQTNVEVTFDKEYSDQPIVSANISLDKIADGKALTKQQNTIFTSNVS